MSTWRLEEPSLGTLTLDRTSGIVVVGWDLGWPTVRAASDPRPDANGEDDVTAYFGARTVTIDCRLPFSPALRQLAAGRVRQFLDPARRIQAVWVSEQYGELRVYGRGDSVANQIAEGMKAASMRLGVRVPSGLIESYAQRTAIVQPGSGTITGRSYDLSYDRSYPDTAVPGALNITNAGTANAWPIIRIAGPCTNPIVRNVTTGGKLAFTYTVAAGDQIEIDTYARTIRLNGLAASSLYDKVDFTTLAWPYLAPGVNDFRYEPSSASSPSQAIVAWRDSYI